MHISIAYVLHADPEPKDFDRASDMNLDTLSKSEAINLTTMRAQQITDLEKLTRRAIAVQFMYGNYDYTKPFVDRLLWLWPGGISAENATMIIKSIKDTH